jgi:NADH-quinone oxidoreductase subunit J
MELLDFLVANFTAVMFYLVAALTVAGAVGVITLRNPVHAALSLLWTFLMVAVLFILRHAEFLAAVQVLVYAGGIMVLFLFVIMLVNVHRLQPERVFLSAQAPVAVAAGVVLGVLMAIALLVGVLAGGGGDPTTLQTVEGEVLGNTEAVGWVLYRTYLVPFEVVSVVLLVAMIAAIVYGRRDAALDGRGGGMEQ